VTERAALPSGYRIAKIHFDNWHVYRDGTFQCAQPSAEFARAWARRDAASRANSRQPAPTHANPRQETP